MGYVRAGAPHSLSRFFSSLSLSEDRLSGCFGDYGMPLLRQALGKNFSLGAVWGIAAITALMLVIRAFGGYSFGMVDLSPSGVVRYALEWGVVFCLVGIFEEFFFRGYLQFTLSSGMGFWPA